MPKVLVSGASGVVGSAALDRFLDKGWDCVAVSRRDPELSSSRPYGRLRVDLGDAEAARAALSGLAGITHLAFTAVVEAGGLINGWTDPHYMQLNLAMLRNTLEPLLGAGGLEQVTILQGTKAYGIHLHPMAIPARESDPRDPHENFYWLQQDLLIEKATKHGFRWNVIRPQPVIGGGPAGAVMSLTQAIGIYAAVCKQNGEPCGYPGGASFVWEASDARLVAGAVEFCASTESAGNQVFNVTNGDVFEWRALWPALMDQLGVEAGPDLERPLATYLPAQAAAWDAVVAEQDLAAPPLDQLLGESHHFADFCFLPGLTREQIPLSFFVSGIKIRQAGFHEWYDTTDTFRYWLGNLQDRKLLPRY